MLLEQVAESDLLRQWDDGSEVGFDAIGLLVGAQAEPLRQSPHVCIHADAGDTECITAQDVRSFAADAGQGEEGVEVVRHAAIEVCDQFGAAGANGASFLAKEAGGAYPRLEFFLRDGGEVARGRKTAEEGWGDFVDLGVGALRGENERDEQVKRRVEVEREAGLRVGAVESRDQFVNRCGSAADGCPLSAPPRGTRRSHSRGRSGGRVGTAPFLLAGPPRGSTPIL